MKISVTGPTNIRHYRTTFNHNSKLVPSIRAPQFITVCGMKVIYKEVVRVGQIASYTTNLYFNFNF
jgi:hypothetical protein